MVMPWRVVRAARRRAPAPGRRTRSLPAALTVMTNRGTRGSTDPALTVLIIQQ